MPSKFPQSNSKSKSFIQNFRKTWEAEPYFVWNIKKLGETMETDLDVFKVLHAVCKEERTTGFTKVKQAHFFARYNSAQCGKFNLLARLNPQA